MIPRVRVLVAAGSGTLGLRLRLMLEAEGAEVSMVTDMMAGVAAAEIQLVVATPSQIAVAGGLAPGATVLEIDEREEWDVVRSRLAAALNPQSGQLSEAEQLNAALARARILLVDDSATYREFLRLELTRLGAQITVCSNAEAALTRLSEGEWDCMLVDLVMPGVDGAELCGRAARLRRDSGKTFVLGVLSSREGKADLIRSLEAGADVFMGKSLDNALFRAKLGAALRRNFLGTK
ncbi:MAG: response regulator transcription factor [Rhodospirillaceae bacterium]|nr:response regulator transcription factor [Rhodospirillales bacterium]